MEESTTEVTNVFKRLAAHLAGNPATRSDESELKTILEKLEYLPADETKPHELRHHVALLEAAGRFPNLFQLAAPDAPGVTFFGAEVSAAGIDSEHCHQARSSASGAGLSLRQGFESCVGEGVEYLSQFETAQDRMQAIAIEDGLAAFDLPSRRMLSEFLRPLEGRGPDRIDWIEARQLSSGRSVPYPADLCLRRTPERSAFVPPFKLSSGCAAGPTFEAAALHGMLELVERDAASLWWKGGIRGRIVALEGHAIATAAALVAQARGGTNTRRTWLLDITTDLGVPSIVAISSRLDGSGFACGLAARLTVQSAVRSALMEMFQMELAYVVVEAKRQEGSALNEYDLRHIARSTRVDTASCELLHPAAPGRQVTEIIAETPTQQLEALVERFSAKGIETFAMDLTRPTFAIPVVRIAAPALQMEPCEIATERLTSARNRTGGGETYTRGITLL
ncbi:MAG TPA: YcaO-like family protein [Bradyrhizobium sp.]|nr:YcaO-like family protein [Bradyrhizobium sp.]